MKKFEFDKIRGFTDFLNELEKNDQLIRITKAVDPKFELAGIVSKLDKGKAIVFESVKDSKIKVAANVLGTRYRIALSVNSKNENLIQERINEAIRNKSEIKNLTDNKIWGKISKNLFHLPIVTHFEKDSGAFITSSLVIAKDKETGTQNLSTHRLLRLDKKRMAIRMVEGRHLHKCFTSAKDHNEDLPVSIIIGTHPAVSVAAAYQAPYGENELNIANSLMRNKLSLTKSPGTGLNVPTNSEILLEGRILADETAEEQMVEMLRTYDIKRKQPVFELDKIYLTSDPIYHDILPGYGEHRLLMGLPIESKIFHSVKDVIPGTRKVHLTDGGSNWLVAVIQIKKRLEGEPKNAIIAAFAGHPSLKIAIVVDDDIDPTNPIEVEYAISTRCQADKDLVAISNSKGSSLDPSSDQNNLLTTKMGIDATATLLKSKDRFEIAKIPRVDKIRLSDYL
ncbi:MAG: UbiD family decarboxylase [Nitrososphaeraceae archaeon]|nr:UbiD family decarboxylase [Nitrososphaeraceae archaeon]MDW0174405.1 UbiD family decarboxylase [Nitrososphaeraceae archaeon]MDW0177749.1 UbiD family decarboxylase [Nitrososphaeraceae archaeon]MDW0183135.1 UbiD family decarboxylase [Nitrososphaeraceae archaeon]MDW0185102.1 UbiD family decarboxylase [Nitrososphaeraceae archaeon]